MKKTETKTIPAVPARMIPYQPERTKTVETIICDLCGKHPVHHECAICGRDVCICCQRVDSRDSSDYAGTWCPHCYRLWKDRYKARLREMETEYEEIEEQLLTDWKAESLAISETEEASQ